MFFLGFMFNIHDLQYWAITLRQFCSPAFDRDSIIKSSAYKRELKVHLTPNLFIYFFFSAEMKLCNIHIKYLIMLSVSGIFKGFKN